MDVDSPAGNGRTVANHLVHGALPRRTFPAHYRTTSTIQPRRHKMKGCLSIIGAIFILLLILGKISFT